MRILTLVPIALLASGCMLPHPPPPPPPPEIIGTAAAVPASCAATIFPTNERVAAGSVDKFAGRYTGRAGALTVRRSDHRLLVDRPGFEVREIATANLDSWSFFDGCGLRYEFRLPPDGPGAWLKIVAPGGGSSDWHRRRH